MALRDSLRALDAQAVDAAIKRSRPEVVIDELTSLPKHYTPDEMRERLDIQWRRHSIGKNQNQTFLPSIVIFRPQFVAKQYDTVFAK